MVSIPKSLSLILLLWASLAEARPNSAAIVTAHPLATEAGIEVLHAGGNAFDAAVAVSAALAVVEPYSSGIGGGGFWLLHRASDGHQVMIDGRETAPSAAHRDLYLDDKGNVDQTASIDGALAAGIPGEPAALAHIATKYGRLNLARSLTPAIRLAREGFPVTERYRRLATFRLDVLRRSPETAKTFLDDNAVPAKGFSIKQPELAYTLTSIGKQGAKGFYRGDVARRLVDGVRAAGGIWTLDDLANYRIREHRPIVSNYKGIRIVSAPPPSSGGIVLIQALNILETYDLKETGGATRIHLIVEALRRAYRDRAQYLGDPEFTSIPINHLIDKEYASRQRASVDLQQATPSGSLPGIQAKPAEGADTTHFSIIDAEGNRVAATLSINYPFGAGIVPPGTGVLLNDEMDDFSARPLNPNVYGLIGAGANAIAPNKRPLSSMTPTFLETHDRVAILGTPGGSRIISMVLLATLDFAAGRPPSSWVQIPRFHHQYIPDQIRFEPGALTKDEQVSLRRAGHELDEMTRRYGNMQAILWNKRNGTVLAASDPRGEGSPIVESSDLLNTSHVRPRSAAKDPHPSAGR